MFHLFPSRNSDNSARGNLNFGGAFGSVRGVVNDGGTKYYPGNADAGLIARAQFYMAVRYDGVDRGHVETLNWSLEIPPITVPRSAISVVSSSGTSQPYQTPTNAAATKSFTRTINTIATRSSTIPSTPGPSS